jgi:hypothetical protein
MTFVFGQAVVVRAELQRESSSHKRDAVYLLKEWQRRPLSAPREGIVVGSRMLQDGSVKLDPEYGPDFRSTSCFSAYIVYYNMRRRPMFVLPEDVEAVADVEPEQPVDASVEKTMADIERAGTMLDAVLSAMRRHCG